MSHRDRDAAVWTPDDAGGWYDTRNAVTALRDVLVAAGVAKHFPYLRAEVNAFGQGIVDVGRTTPEAASRLAELLALGMSLTPQAAGDATPEGRASARHATSDLADELIRAGLVEEFAGLRADVSVRGDGLVCIGPVTAEAAHRLAVLLARGLCVELDDTLDGISDAAA